MYDAKFPVSGLGSALGVISAHAFVVPLLFRPPAVVFISVLLTAYWIAAQISPQSLVVAVSSKVTVKYPIGV